jgi:hypothetical protein
MTHNEMLTLIEQSGLQLISCYPHRRYYGLCLEVNGRFQNDELCFTQEEFDAMTTQEAKDKIEYSRADMARAAKTVSGLLKREMKQTKKVNSEIVVKDVKSKDSDAEKYLRKMRARGQKLAKTVVYR